MEKHTLFLFANKFALYGVAGGIVQSIGGSRWCNRRGGVKERTFQCKD
jgi:hypothetical protein